jgi:hypothetical protein
MKPMGEKSAENTANKGVKNKIIAERERPPVPIGAAKIPAGRIQAAQNQTRSSQASTKSIQVSAK